MRTTQTLQNNEEQMKGLLERVRLLGWGSPALESLPFWYSVLVIARSIWVTLFPVVELQELCCLISSVLSPSEQNYLSPLACTGIWVSNTWVPVLLSFGVFFGVLIPWEVAGSFLFFLLQESCPELAPQQVKNLPQPIFFQHTSLPCTFCFCSHGMGFLVSHWTFFCFQLGLLCWKHFIKSGISCPPQGPILLSSVSLCL